QPRQRPEPGTVRNGDTVGFAKPDESDAKRRGAMRLRQHTHERMRCEGSSKLQAPSSREAPGTKRQALQQSPRGGRTPLELEIWDFSGAWGLELGPFANPGGKQRANSASTFIIVLWIAFGLVSVALYFGQTMSFEL